MLTTLAFEAMAFLILLITCTNVSALVVGAGVSRRHEIAIRLSLGASRGRLVRQLLTESTLLALAGGALGLLFYWWISTLLAVQLPKQNIAPDFTTIAFTIVIAAGTGILFGLSPALHATRRGTSDALKDSAGGAPARSRLQRGLVVAQIALTQPLLVGLGVTMKIVLDDSDGRPNADIAGQTISAVFVPPQGVTVAARDVARLKQSVARREQSTRTDAALRRVAGLPGVLGVIPHGGTTRMDLVVLPDDRSRVRQSSTPFETRVEMVSPEYFSLLEIPIVRGRALVATDSAAHDVPIVIGSDLAHELWATDDPLGKRLEESSGPREARRRHVVVGVYDSRRGIASGSGPLIYAPIGERFFDGYLIRTAGPATATMASVQAMLRAEIPQIPVNVLETLAERDEANRAEALRVSGAAGGGGVLALLLASIGLYGVIALALAQRRREIGIRIALGARPGRVVRMLFQSGLWLSIAGLALGLPLSVLAMSIAARTAQLPDINIVVVGATIALLVIGVASFATWLPARRAASVDPMIALRD
jgi:predicted permease